MSAAHDSGSPDAQTSPAGDGSPASSSSSTPSTSEMPDWILETIDASNRDTRSQPWRHAFGDEVNCRIDDELKAAAWLHDVPDSLPLTCQHITSMTQGGQIVSRYESQVVVPLKFLQWQPLYETEKPFQIFINIPDSVEDKRTTNLVFEDIPTKIRDVRQQEAEFSLDEHGFTFCQHSFRPFDHNDRYAVENTYLPEVEELFRCKLENVDKVFFFDWRLRINAPEIEGSVIDLNDLTTWLRPAMHVHIDQSPAAVLKRIRLQLPEEADRLLKGRVRVINAWRPLIDRIEDWPLAVCDGSTVDTVDLVEADHVRRHYMGSTMYLKHNPRQKFYYMNHQTRDEVLLFKNFDSDRSKRANFAPHASFLSPHDKIQNIPRKSIEVRAMVFTFAHSDSAR